MTACHGSYLMNGYTIHILFLFSKLLKRNISCTFAYGWLNTKCSFISVHNQYRAHSKDHESIFEKLYKYEVPTKLIVSLISIFLCNNYDTTVFQNAESKDYFWDNLYFRSGSGNNWAVLQFQFQWWNCAVQRSKCHGLSQNERAIQALQQNRLRWV